MLNSGCATLSIGHNKILLFIFALIMIKLTPQFLIGYIHYTPHSVGEYSNHSEFFKILSKFPSVACCLCELVRIVILYQNSYMQCNMGVIGKLSSKNTLFLYSNTLVCFC